MKLLDTANKFGEDLAASKEYTRLLKAEKEFKDDKNARELLEKFRKKQKVLNSSDEYGIVYDSKEIRKELTGIFEEIENNQVIKEFNEALSDFLLLKQNLFEKIEGYVTIDDEILSLNKTHGCNKGCGGCKK